MSPISLRLCSVIFVLSVAVVGYSLGDGVERVTAADSPRVEVIEVPGAFKDLPEATNAITSKPVDETKMVESERLSLDELSVDTNKGLTQTKDRELLDFQATAYCLKGRTASGQHVRPGVIAADPKLLPLGTVVHLRAGTYTGTYTVLDTGGRIRGRMIDVYVPTYKEAMQFGRRPVKIKVLSRAKGTRGKTVRSPAVAELTQ